MQKKWIGWNFGGSLVPHTFANIRFSLLYNSFKNNSAGKNNNFKTWLNKVQQSN